MIRQFNVFMLVLVSIFVVFGCSKKEPQGESSNNVLKASVDTETAQAASAEEQAPAGSKTLPCKAASLEGLTYIKGEPVTLTEGNVYLVEYWATWCPPCVKSIPHLTELQKKYSDKGLTVIGISNETADVAGPFVKKKGNEMDYTVAVDPEQVVSKGYTIAFEQNAIPVAFVIDRKGDVVWVGNPQEELDYVVEQIVTVGSLDPEKVAEAKAGKQQKMMKQVMKIEQYYADIRSGKPTEELRPLAKEIISNKDFPFKEPFFLQMVQLPKSQRDNELLTKFVNEWLAKGSMGQNDMLSMMIAARFLFDDGQVDKAIEIQEKIVSMLSSGSDMLDANGLQLLDNMKATLEEYQAAKEASDGKHAMPKLTESNANISFSADQIPSDKAIKSDIAKNPIITDIYTADPAALVSDGTFYIFCGHEVSPDDNWPFIVPDWHILSSTDMKNWSDHGAILKSTDVSWINTNECWASHCVEKDGTFYWYICDSSEVGVVTSNNILGPYTDPVGAPIVPSKYAGIDPHCFIDDDGQAYLYWSGNGGCYQSKLSSDMLSITGEVKHYRLTDWIEAPWVFKRNGTYYLMYSASDGYRLGPIKYATSDNPLGPWIVVGDCLGQVTSFANHEAAVEYKGQWYMVYHNAEAPDGSCYKRSVCVDKMYWNEDGTIQKVIQTPVTKHILPLSDKIGQTWKYTVRKPESNWYESSFDDSGWEEAEAPFGDVGICRTKTKWSEDTIWLRKTFNPGELTATELASTRLRIWYDNDLPRIYINGVLAFTEEAYTSCYVTRDLTQEAIESIRPDQENTIAVKCTRKDGVVLIDAGLYSKLGNARPATPLDLAPATKPAKPAKPVKPIKADKTGVLWKGGPYTFDGIEDHVELPDGVVSGCKDFTVASWVKLDSVSMWARVFDFGDGQVNYMFLTPRAGNGNVRYGIKTSDGGEQMINGTYPLRHGLWEHVAVTLSGNKGTLYVNGVEVGTNSAMTLKPADLGSTTNNWIGRSNWSADPRLNGKITDFVFYNRTLDASAIAKMAKVDPEGNVPTPPPTRKIVDVTSEQADNPLFKDFRSADPSPFVHDGRFYIVCGQDREVTGPYDFLMPSWRLLSSADMKTWKYHGEILRPDQVSWMPKDRAWASDIVYRNEYFYLYVSNDWQVAVFRSKNVEGPYEDVLGKPLIDSTTPNHSNRDIDPHCFIDDDGKTYLFWGGDGAFRYVKLNDDMISFASEVMTVSGVSGAGYSSLEAPFVIKENDTYFFMFATQPWASEIHYATAPTIHGPWTYQARIGAATGNGTNHPGAAYFKGQWWYTYHTEELSKGNPGSRCVCVDKMYINGDQIEPVDYTSFWTK